MQSIFTNFSRGEVVKDVVLLPYGDHKVVIHNIKLTSDIHLDLTEGKLKSADQRPEWVDETPQLAVTYKGIDPETGKVTGVITHRYNGLGYMRYSELTEAGLDPERYFAAGDEGYAVHEASRQRVPSDERTKQALNIVNQLCAAAGIPIGGQLEELVGKELIITVYPRLYNGREIARVKNPRSLASEVPANVVAEESKDAE
jgi:hypothetical protein